MNSFSFLPNTDDDRRIMLEKLGFSSIRELLKEMVPKELLYKTELPMPKGLSEIEVSQILDRLASKNIASQMKQFIGGGAYDMFVPAAVDEISSRPEFYTAYTPYQPEVSQGTLTAVFQFQSMIAGITGMDVANASMYDGASAVAEAAILAIHRTGRKKILVSSGINPFYLQVIKSYIHGYGVETIEIPLSPGTETCSQGQTCPETLGKLIDDNTACFILQNPNFFGIIEDGTIFAELVHKKGALYIITIQDPMSLGILKPPREYDADVVCGEAQQFGNYLNFGGPYLGFFAARKEFTRQMPGRIVGQTNDIDGNRGFVMTFQTREQHIRRAGATSNICTNQQLCALRATVYLALLGSKGFKYLSKLLFDRAHYLASKLNEINNISLLYNGHFFREFALELPVNAEELIHSAADSNYLPGLALGKIFPGMDNVLLTAVSDKNNREDMDQMVKIIKECIR